MQKMDKKRCRSIENGSKKMDIGTRSGLYGRWIAAEIVAKMLFIAIAICASIYALTANH